MTRLLDRPACPEIVRALPSRPLTSPINLCSQNPLHLSVTCKQQRRRIGLHSKTVNLSKRCAALRRNMRAPLMRLWRWSALQNSLRPLRSNQHRCNPAQRQQVHARVGVTPLQPQPSAQFATIRSNGDMTKGLRLPINTGDPNSQAMPAALLSASKRLGLGGVTIVVATKPASQLHMHRDCRSWASECADALKGRTGKSLESRAFRIPDNGEIVVIQDHAG